MFGIIEQPSPTALPVLHDDSLTERGLEHTLLWHPRVRIHPGIQMIDDRAKEVRLRCNFVTYHSLTETIMPDELVLHDYVIWARKLNELSSIGRFFFQQRLSTDGDLVVSGVMPEYGTSGINYQRFCLPFFGEGNFRTELDGNAMTGSSLVHFDIAGPEGERVVEVGVNSKTRPKAIKVST